MKIWKNQKTHGFLLFLKCQNNMRKNTNVKFKLGIFVVIGLVLFVLGIYYLGRKQNLFQQNFTVRGIFKNVAGLQVGNNVRFSGINIGTVDMIQIVSDSTVLVECLIDESVKKFIKKDARVIIGSEGLMGNKVINIIPGDSSLVHVDHQDTLTSIKPFEIDDILKDVKATALNAQVITSNLAEMTSNINRGRGVIGKMLSDTIFAKRLDRTVVNIDKSAKGLSENMEAAKESFLLKPLFKKKKKKEKEEEKKAAENQEQDAQAGKANENKQEKKD